MHRCVYYPKCSTLAVYTVSQVDLRHVEEEPPDDRVKIGVDLTDFYLSVEWDILDVPAIRWAPDSVRGQLRNIEPL